MIKIPINNPEYNPAMLLLSIAIPLLIVLEIEIDLKYVPLSHS